MQRLKYKSLIGLRGVAHSENARARYWARKFEFPMIMMATWIIMEWYASALGGLLILFGLGLFSLITASFSAFLLAKDEEEIIRDEKEELTRLRRIEERMERLEKLLKRVESSVSKDR